MTSNASASAANVVASKKLNLGRHVAVDRETALNGVQHGK